MLRFDPAQVDDLMDDIPLGIIHWDVITVGVESCACQVGRKSSGRKRNADSELRAIFSFSKCSTPHPHPCPPMIAVPTETRQPGNGEENAHSSSFVPASFIDGLRSCRLYALLDVIY
jgi:hypothetical protein